MHSNLAIRWFITNKSTWKSVTWFVSVLKGGFSVDKYRQLARFHNHHHYPKHYILLTFYDELNNLCSEYDRLSQASSNISNNLVAKTCFGQETVSQMMKMLSSTAIRLSHHVLNTLAEMSNSEHPNLTVGWDDIDLQGATTSTDDAKVVDCRFNSNLVKLHSLYSSKVLMDVKADNEVEAIFNTLYHLRDLSKMNVFWTVGNADVTE